MTLHEMLPIIGDFFSQHPYLGIGFAGFIAFIESLAIVGSIIPGSIMMSIVGFLLGIGILPLQPTMISIFIGAFSGDMVSYALGAWYQNHFRNHEWVQPYHHWVTQGESFMKEYGAFSIIIGRFFGPMRSIIPLIAGLANMHIARFTIAIIPTIALWAIVYLTPGVILGALSIDMGESYFTHLLSNTFFYIVVFVIWHSLYSIIQLLAPLHRRFPNINSTNLTHILKGSLLFIFAVFLAYNQYYYPPETNWLNMAAYHYSLIQSSQFNIEVAQVISLMSGHITYILINCSVALVLYYHHHKRTALIWSLASSGLFFITWGLKYTLLISRPNPILGNTGFPSGHILLFITFLLCLSIILENCSLLYALLLRRFTFLLALLITISRLILQAHWFIDLIASTCLSLSIWHFISIWKHDIPTIPVPHLRQIGSAILLIIIPYTIIYQQLPTDIRPSIPKIISINATSDLEYIPRVRYSRLGHPVAPINFIYIGNRNDLTSFFNQEGFNEYPASGNLIARIQTLFHYSEYHDVLPILPPLFERRGPDVIFGKKDATHAYIAKIWHIPGKIGGYIGTVSLETYPEAFFSPSLLLCQKERFNIESIFKQRGHIKKTPSVSITQAKSAFCWNGGIFVID